MLATLRACSFSPGNTVRTPMHSPITLPELSGFIIPDLFILLISPVLLGLASSAMGDSGSGGRSSLALFQKISSMILQSTDLRSTLESLLHDLLDLTGMDAGIFALVPSADTLQPISVSRGLTAGTASAFEAELRSNNGLSDALSQNSRVTFDDLCRVEAAVELAQALQKENVASLDIYRIQSRSRIVGILGLANRKTGPIEEAQNDLVQTVVGLVGVAISNLQLSEQAGKLSEDLVALQEMNKIISQSLNLDQIIHRIVVEGRRLVKCRECHLFLVDDRNQSLVGTASTQPEPDIRALEIKFSEQSLSMTALTEKRVIAVQDPSHDPITNQRILGEMKWRSAIFAPLLTKDQPIGVLIFRDSSREGSFRQEEILRAEALAHQAAIALENARLFHVVSRSQKEWETTFDAMQDCVSVHDTTGKVIRANVALARRLNTIPHKLVGKYCSELYSPAGLSLIPCRHTRTLQSESLTVEETDLPLMGGIFQISVTPWYDKNNRLAGSIHVAKDISNERLLQQQLIQSEKLSAIGELISGIAHELNNPLTGVMGYSQLLQIRKDLDERAKDSLLKINNLALRCQRIVQNLLSFARKQKPERTICELNEILDRTIELRNYELQVNNIEIVRELDRYLPRTIADSHQLQQVFLNLITNAEQAMLVANGKGKLVIRTRFDSPHGRIIIEIIDDGPGIPEAYLSKIFDPFFTTKEVGKGTGLGLSLAYGIIKEHDGNIYVRSKVGEGASFVIELPIISAVQDELRITSARAGSDVHFEDVIRDRRILVVDDERYILDFFVEVFRMFPMSVDTAENGRSAIDRIKASKYDLIITDFKMPQMGGQELFNWIKRERPDLTNRIIFVTGDTVSTETKTFFERNCSRYLAKPFKIEEVKDVISRTLEECQTES